MADKTIRVLLVDDSPTALESMQLIIATADDMQVVGAITDPRRAAAEVKRLHPDLVVMDYAMPGLDGAEVTRQIMAHHAVPILIVTGVDSIVRKRAEFCCLEAGAVDLASKDRLFQHADDASTRQGLLRRMRVVAGVPVVRRREFLGLQPPPDKVPSLPTTDTDSAAAGEVRIVALGASTGGPPTLRKVLENLMHPFPTPIVIVQHLGAEFVPGFAVWLDNVLPLRVTVAEDGERLKPSVVYLAPGDLHLTVDCDLRAHLDDTAPLHSCRPSVDRLFFSLAELMQEKAVAALLTGMGRDGAAGLKAMRDVGAYTIIQDEESSLVFGMPGEARRLGAHVHMGPPATVASLIDQRVAGTVGAP